VSDEVQPFAAVAVRGMLGDWTRQAIAVLASTVCRPLVAGRWRTDAGHGGRQRLSPDSDRGSLWHGLCDHAWEVIQEIWCCFGVRWVMLRASQLFGCAIVMLSC
jgi:hypothetical protein